jgi:hypothetical protein
VAIALLALGVVALCVPTSAGAQPSARGVLKAGELPQPLPLFPADNWWNTDISQAPLDARSDAFVQFIGPTRTLHPDWGHESGDTLPDPIIYGMPYIVVSGSEPLEPVTFDYDDESDAGAPGRPPGYPIPVEARSEPRWIEGGVPGGGSSGDRHLLIVDRDRRLLFELYALRWDIAASRWFAGSGAVFPLDSNLRRPETWTSADAAGLAILPGLVRYDEMVSTQPIRHAFRVTVRATNGYVYPASHRAGSNPSALPMGARLRLKASKDLSQYSPEMRRIFQAMKTYGLIVADNGSDMFITGTYDPRWNMGPILTAFRSLRASDFEVVQLGWRPPAQPPPPTDADGDGLPDDWERQAGLDPGSGTGDNGRDGDPDGDGVPNWREFDDHTHPRGVPRRYFAEGVTSGFFDTQFALFNPGDSSANLLLRFERSDGAIVTAWRTLGPLERQTLDVGGVSGMQQAEFATRIEAGSFVVADRTVSWDRAGYGAHADTGVVSPAQQWYFAEGATHSGFDLFYLLQNPSGVSADVRVDFLRPGGQPVISRSYSMAPNSRQTIWVNQVDPLLATAEVSAIVSTTAPGGIVAERAMYLSRGGQTFAAGHAAAGVSAPWPRWFLAEGATGPLFDEFVLLANPNDSLVVVDLRFLLPDGRVLSSSRTVPAASRETVWVNHEHPDLARAAVSVIAESRGGEGIIVERAMWWPASGAWHEAHASVGTTEDGEAWAVAAGESGPGLSTYVLVANVADVAAPVTFTVCFEGGAQTLVSRVLPPNSRTTIDVGAEVPGASGRRFAVLVEGTAGARLVVERAIYWDAGGVSWAAGTSATGVKLR